MTKLRYFAESFDDNIQDETYKESLFFDIDCRGDQKTAEKLVRTLNDNDIPHARYVNGIVIYEFKKYTTDLTINGITGIECEGEMPTGSHSHTLFTEKMVCRETYHEDTVNDLKSKVENKVRESSQLGVDVKFLDGKIGTTNDQEDGIKTIVYEASIYIPYFGSSLSDEIKNDVIESINTHIESTHKLIAG